MALEGKACYSRSSRLGSLRVHSSETILCGSFTVFETSCKCSGLLACPQPGQQFYLFLVTRVFRSRFTLGESRTFRTGGFCNWNCFSEPGVSTVLIHLPAIHLSV